MVDVNEGVRAYLEQRVNFGADTVSVRVAEEDAFRAGVEWARTHEGEKQMAGKIRNDEDVPAGTIVMGTMSTARVEYEVIETSQNEVVAGPPSQHPHGPFSRLEVPRHDAHRATRQYRAGGVWFMSTDNSDRRVRTARWQRKRDGVIVSAEERRPSKRSTDYVLATREDNGHRFWVTYGGLYRKYDRIVEERS